LPSQLPGLAHLSPGISQLVGSRTGWCAHHICARQHSQVLRRWGRHCGRIHPCSLSA
jgi:hypothetical protein